MSKFQEYVTTQAFALTLSRKMCEALNHLKHRTRDSGGFEVFYQIGSHATVSALVERGLIFHDIDQAKRTGPYRLTEAGELLYPVLVHAGLCSGVETTAKQAA